MYTHTTTSLRFVDGNTEILKWAGIKGRDGRRQDSRRYENQDGNQDHVTAMVGDGHWMVDNSEEGYKMYPPHGNCYGRREKGI